MLSQAFPVSYLLSGSPDPDWRGPRGPRLLKCPRKIPCDMLCTWMLAIPVANWSGRRRPRLLKCPKPLHFATGVVQSGPFPQKWPWRDRRRSRLQVYITARIQ